MPFQHLDDGDVADAYGFGDLAGGVACFVGGADAVAVLLHGGSAPLVGALHTGEGLHLQQALGAIQKRLGLVHAALILKPQRLVDQVVREGDAVVRVVVDVLLGASVQRVCGGLRSGHTGNLGYRAGFVKGLV